MFAETPQLEPQPYISSPRAIHKLVVACSWRGIVRLQFYHLTTCSVGYSEAKFFHSPEVFCLLDWDDMLVLYFLKRLLFPEEEKVSSVILIKSSQAETRYIGWGARWFLFHLPYQYRSRFMLSKRQNLPIKAKVIEERLVAAWFQSCKLITRLKHE